MKILHFYKTSLLDTHGGMEQFIDQLAQGTTALGLENEVLALTSAKSVLNPVKFNRYLVHRARLNFQIASTGFSISAIRYFKRLAKKADIIHYHFPWPFMDLVHFIARIRKPTVVTYQSDIVRQKYLFKFYRPLMYRFLASVDRIVATSPQYFASSPVLKHFSNKVEVIPNGLDKASYPIPNLERFNYWQQRLPKKFFLFVGVIRYYKGLHILIEAAQKARYPIVIVGAGPLLEELKSQAQRLGLDHIYFLGRLAEEDKITLLQLCYAMLFPSHLRSEAFGISLLEGAMYGKPLISSEIGTATSFINLNNETGLVIPPNNPLALQHAMDDLWHDPERALQMGMRAEQRYQSCFTAKKMAESYAKLYQDLLDTSV